MMSLLIRLIDLYSLLILISVILSWVDRYGNNQLTIFVRKITDPFLNLFKIVVPVGSMKIDVSPIIAIYLLDLLKKGLYRLF